MKQFKFFFGVCCTPAIVIFISFIFLGIKEAIEVGMTFERFKELIIGIPMISMFLYFIGYIMESDKIEQAEAYQKLNEVL